MNVFDIPCPTCGAQAGALCLSADILEGVKEIKGGHKARRKAAFQLVLHRPKNYSSPESFDFSPYGSPVQTIDKTSAAWHLIKRVGVVMSSQDPQLNSALVDIAQRTLALDELRAQGAREDVLEVDKAALRERVTALGESGRLVLSLDQLLILVGAK